MATKPVESATLPGVPVADAAKQATVVIATKRLAAVQRSLDTVREELSLIEHNPIFTSRVTYLKNREKSFANEVLQITDYLVSLKG